MNSSVLPQGSNRFNFYKMDGKRKKQINATQDQIKATHNYTALLINMEHAIRDHKATILTLKKELLS